MRGKLIVIEGLDGCGKTTQATRLAERLAAEGKEVRYITFPDYDDDSSKLVQMYLRGDFGSKPGDVNAYAATSFFAVDRYASFVRYWRSEYENGSYIIANRYTTSNANHQMCKLDESEWEKYLTWLFDYEYNLLGLPAPDLVIQLTMPNEVSQQLMSGRYDGDEAKKDIHERALEYQQKCRVCAEYLAQKYNWPLIQCTKDGDLMSVEKISDIIWNKVTEAGLI